MTRVLSVVAILAMALVGVAPAVVCAMPPECPMAQAPLSHSCCTQMPATPGDGWTKTPCHPEVVSALAARFLEATPSVLPFLGVAALSTSPDCSAPLLVSAPPSTVPRFLLTHTFRL